MTLRFSLSSNRISYWPSSKPYTYIVGLCFIGYIHCAAKRSCGGDHTVAEEGGGISEGRWREFVVAKPDRQTDRDTERERGGDNALLGCR